MGENVGEEEAGEAVRPKGEDRPERGDMKGGEDEIDDAGEIERAGEGGGSGGDILTALEGELEGS